MSRESEHSCHADGCDNRVPPRMFMCRSHWYRLPKRMRDRLLELYVPGQERRLDPSLQYVAHAMACVEYIRSQEAAG